MNARICPLLLVNPREQQEYDCIEEACAWYVEECKQCAIVLIGAKAGMS